MGIRDSIFDSKTERKLFHRLQSTWNKAVDIHPQIPIRHVIEYSTIKDMKLPTKREIYLLEAEFDFVICEKEIGKPIMAIEFDGIGHGFSKGGKYRSKAVPLNDPYRKLKLDAKLDLCRDQEFSLVVVSWAEIDSVLKEKDSVTILDGIIGKVLARKSFQQQLSNLSEVDVTVEDIFDIEFEAEIEWNPIQRETAVMMEEVDPLMYSSMYWLYDREEYIGTKLSGKIENEDVSVSTYLRDLNCLGVSSLAWLAVQIGEYRFFKKVINKIGADNPF